MTRKVYPTSLVALLWVGACSAGGISTPVSTAPEGTPTGSVATRSTAPTTVPSIAATVSPTPRPALLASLGGPDSAIGLVVDAAGNVYVSECKWTYAVIHRIDANGMMTIFAGTGAPGFAGDGGPATSAQFYCPRGMAFGPDGALYVVDHVNNRVRRIDAAGIITTIAGSGAAGLDLGSFSGDGGPATQATLQEPWPLAFDLAAGNLYIGDRDNNRIRKIDRTGTISTIAGNGKRGYSGDGVLGSQTSIDTPYGVGVDGKGDVIFSDGINMRVRMVDPDGIITTIAGTGLDASTGDGGPAAKAAVEPGDLLVGPTGDVYVTDDLSHRLRRIDANGIITTVVGNGTAGIPEDGTKAVDAPFAAAASPTMDGAGNLYVTDGTSVYRIDAKGILTRVAGKR